jgi:ABC-type uncharacterized transport system permease subunit
MEKFIMVWIAGKTVRDVRWMPLTLTRVLAAAAGSLLATSAQAQWTVTNLHPAGALTSAAFSTSGTQQVGIAKVGGVVRASVVFLY